MNRRYENIHLRACALAGIRATPRKCERRRASELNLIPSGRFAKLTGVTSRQLLYWHQHRVLVSVWRYGTWRYYEQSQVRRAILLREIHKRLRVHVTKLQLPALAITRRFLIIEKTGRIIAATDNPQDAIRASADAGRGVYLFDAGSPQGRQIA